MNQAFVLVLVLVALLAWLLPHPGSSSRIEPVAADAECAECGMSIADPRFAARMIVLQEGGLKTLHFDDVGCLFDHERWHPDLLVRRREFAVTHQPRWLASDAVAFVVDPRIATPMGTGLLAIEGSQAAARRSTGERIESFDEAAAFRKQWMESRFGKPTP